MRPIKKQEVSLLASIDTCNPSSSYRWVSVCGKETNFVATEDEIASVGFTDLDGTSGDLLYAAGQLSEPFDPDMLRIASSTGRLYHPVNNHRFLKVVYKGLIVEVCLFNFYLKNFSTKI